MYPPTQITAPHQRRRYQPTRESVALAGLAGFMLGFGFVQVTTGPPEPVPVIVEIGEPETIEVGRNPESVTHQPDAAELGKTMSEGFDR